MIKIMNRPTLCTTYKGYTLQKLGKELFVGILVAIIALPLSIALAIASGVSPEIGLYTGIVGGFVVAIFSGSRVQIGGITAATVMTVNVIIGHYGIVGLAITTITAGILLILMGVLKLGTLLKYIPITITTGFTAGIAIGIFTSQVKEFFGLTVNFMPINILEKWIALGKAYTTVNPIALIIGMIALILLICLPKVTTKIPASVGMLTIMTLSVKLFQIPVNTVASVYGTLPSKLPEFVIPPFTLHMVQELIMQSLTLAFLVAIVSLLSCAVTDGMIGEQHDSNTELIAQGLANICCGLFGAAPVAGAVARSKSSIDNGGTSQVVGIVHCIVLLFFLLVMMPIIGLIPMPALSAMLMHIAYDMINWQEVGYTLKYAPKSDGIVLFATVIMAVVFDLMTAIIVGFVVSNLLFMKRMSDESSVSSWRYVEDEEDEAVKVSLRRLPKDTEVFEISGPMFFAVSEKILHIKPKSTCKYLILRMRSVTAIDATAMHRLEQIITHCKKRKIRVLLTHLNDQPRAFLQKAGIIMIVGEENVCDHMDDAITLINNCEDMNR